MTKVPYRELAPGIAAPLRNPGESIVPPSFQRLAAELQLRLAALEKNDVLTWMGYAKPTPALRARLDRVRRDPWLGLGSGDFDFCYDSQRFLHRLCGVAGLPKGVIEPALEEAQRVRHWLQFGFKPRLTATTPFQKRGQPAFALAAMKAQREVNVPTEVATWPIHDQLGWAQRCILDHMRETAGELPFWGVIQAYCYRHAPDEHVWLSTQGEILPETERHEIEGIFPGATSVWR